MKTNILLSVHYEYFLSTFCEHYKSPGYRLVSCVILERCKVIIFEEVQVGLHNTSNSLTSVKYFATKHRSTDCGIMHKALHIHRRFVTRKPCTDIGLFSIYSEFTELYGV